MVQGSAACRSVVCPFRRGHRRRRGRGRAGDRARGVPAPRLRGRRRDDTARGPRSGGPCGDCGAEFVTDWAWLVPAVPAVAALLGLLAWRLLPGGPAVPAI